MAVHLCLQDIFLHAPKRFLKRRKGEVDPLVY